METHTINDVEIFQVGEWNGDKYTEKDLDSIVESFQAIGGKLKPYLKLGHDKGQKLIQKDGLPAAGWITNVKRNGKKLMATFANVPGKIKDLIEKKAYGRISSEIYWNLTEGGKRYPRALKAVALLGADTPAVTTLDDFINLYTTDKDNYDEIKTHTMEVKIMDEVKTYEKELHDAELKIKEYEIENDNLKKEIGEIKEDVKVKEFTFIEKEVDSYLEKAIEDKKMKPADKENYLEIALDRENKTYGKFEHVKKIVENSVEATESKEFSEAVEVEKDVDPNDPEKASEILHDKAMNYIKENKLEDNLENYKLALVEVENV